MKNLLLGLVLMISMVTLGNGFRVLFRHSPPQMIAKTKYMDTALGGWHREQENIWECRPMSLQGFMSLQQYLWKNSDRRVQAISLRPDRGVIYLASGHLR